MLIAELKLRRSGMLIAEVRINTEDRKQNKDKR